MFSKFFSLAVLLVLVVAGDFYLQYETFNTAEIAGMLLAQVSASIALVSIASVTYGVVKKRWMSFPEWLNVTLFTALVIAIAVFVVQRTLINSHFQSAAVSEMNSILNVVSFDAEGGFVDPFTGKPPSFPYRGSIKSLRDCDFMVKESYYTGTNIINFNLVGETDLGVDMKSVSTGATRILIEGFKNSPLRRKSGYDSNGKEIDHVRLYAKDNDTAYKLINLFHNLVQSCN